MESFEPPTRAMETSTSLQRPKKALPSTPSKLSPTQDVAKPANAVQNATLSSMQPWETPSSWDLPSGSESNDCNTFGGTLSLEPRLFSPLIPAAERLKLEDIDEKTESPLLYCEWPAAKNYRSSPKITLPAPASAMDKIKVETPSVDRQTGSTAAVDAQAPAKQTKISSFFQPVRKRLSTGPQNFPRNGKKAPGDPPHVPVAPKSTKRNSKQHEVASRPPKQDNTSILLPTVYSRPDKKEKPRDGESINRGYGKKQAAEKHTHAISSQRETSWEDVVGDSDSFEEPASSSPPYSLSSGAQTGHSSWDSAANTTKRLSSDSDVLPPPLFTPRLDSPSSSPPSASSCLQDKTRKSKGKAKARASPPTVSQHSRFIPDYDRRRPELYPDPTVRAVPAVVISGDDGRVRQRFSPPPSSASPRPGSSPRVLPAPPTPPTRPRRRTPSPSASAASHSGLRRDHAAARAPPPAPLPLPPSLPPSAPPTGPLPPPPVPRSSPPLASPAATVSSSGASSAGSGGGTGARGAKPSKRSLAGLLGKRVLASIGSTISGAGNTLLQADAPVARPGAEGGVGLGIGVEGRGREGATVKGGGSPGAGKGGGISKDQIRVVGAVEPGGR